MTSWRASRSSCTSEAPARATSGRPSPPSGFARLGGLFRLVHPYPSILNGAITAAVALVAGGSPATAARLAIAMVCLQFSIGSLNDLMDAPHDAGRKPRKPIPAGLVGVGEARGVVVLGAVVGLSLAGASGPLTLCLAAAGLTAGYLYDLRLKGSAVSWAPFALGIPLLPVYAWVGATGIVPGAFLLVVPLGALAGTGLAIGNALADYERDQDAGVASVATRLGMRRAWTAHAEVHATVVAAAAIAAGIGGGTWTSALPAAAAGGVILAGVALARAASPGRRELAWEVEAAGTGLLGIVWLAAMAGHG